MMALAGCAEEEIKESRAILPGDEEVVLPVIRTKPEMLYHGDIADGPDTWPNTDLEKYYGVDRVYLETYFTSENK